MLPYVCFVAAGGLSRPKASVSQGQAGQPIVYFICPGGKQEQASDCIIYPAGSECSHKRDAGIECKKANSTASPSSSPKPSSSPSPSVGPSAGGGDGIGAPGPASGGDGEEPDNAALPRDTSSPSPSATPSPRKPSTTPSPQPTPGAPSGALPLTLHWPALRVTAPTHTHMQHHTHGLPACMH